MAQRSQTIDPHGPLTHDAARSTEPRLLCIVGIARTGTNHLAAVLDGIPEIDTRRELFNPLKCWTMHPHELAELSRRSGKVFPHTVDSQQTVNVIRRRPGLALDCLADLKAPEKRILCFKVFRGQLSRRQVRKAIISRPDTIIVFARRRPIDAYVSYRKATYLKQWARVDTTDLKVTLDAAAFLKWWRLTSTWFLRLEAACWAMGKPFHRLSYEDDIDCPPAESARRFCAILEANGIRNLTMPPEDKAIGLTRQDLNRDVENRVANWPEFHRRLSEMGALEKAFAPFPHYQPSTWDKFRHRLFGARRAPHTDRSLAGSPHRA